MFSYILFGGIKKTTAKGSLPPHLRPTWSMSRILVYIYIKRAKRRVALITVYGGGVL
jgi:hypothetical protein